MIELLTRFYETFTTPNNWKDYIIPFCSPILGIGGAYWVMKSQVRRAGQIEDEKIASENGTLVKYILLNIDEVLKDISFNQKEVFHFYIENYKFENRFSMTSFYLRRGSLDSLGALEDIRVFNALIEPLKQEEFRNIYVIYLNVLKNSIGLMDYYNELYDNFLKDYNVYRLKIDDIFQRFYVEFDKVVQSSELDIKNKLIKPNDWLDEKLQTMRENFHDSTIKDSPIYLMSKFVDETFEYVRPSSTSQDHYFLQTYFAELRIQLDLVERLINDFSENISSISNELNSASVIFSKFRSELNEYSVKTIKS